MRHIFEKNLKKYGDTIKDSFKDLSKEGKLASAQKKDAIIESVAQNSNTNKEAELEIYAIQKQKLERLNKFKKFLENTRTKDGGFEYAVMNKEGSLARTVTQQGGEFFVISKNGTKQPITISEIMTDGEWGIEYTFDNSVNIYDIRSYYLEALKSDLREKLDKQIIISETHNTRVDTHKQVAYKEIEKRMEQPSTQEGVVAEKMVKNFLKKLSIDTNADFEIIDADVHQDVEQKIDFIIHRRRGKKVRGASVEESDEVTDIGIQFTTNLSKTQYKEKQVEKSRKHIGEDIDDIVLVTLPAYQASMLYKKWQDNKEPGGPEKKWDNKTKETIFRGVMDNVLSQEEIETFCRENFSQDKTTLF